MFEQRIMGEIDGASQLGESLREQAKDASAATRGMLGKASEVAAAAEQSALAMREGKPYMCFGTPGGDVQASAMLQVFLNATQFGMHLQQAVEAPRFSSANFPNSFPPHEYFPGRLCIEENAPEGAIDALRALGHDVEVLPRLPAKSGAVCAVMREPASGLRYAAADPRRECYALAW